MHWGGALNTSVKLCRLITNTHALGLFGLWRLLSNFIRNSVARLHAYDLYAVRPASACMSLMYTHTRWHRSKGQHTKRVCLHSIWTTSTRNTYTNAYACNGNARFGWCGVSYQDCRTERLVVACALLIYTKKSNSYAEHTDALAGNELELAQYPPHAPTNG